MTQVKSSLSPELDPEQLHRSCEPARLGCTSTAELEVELGAVGQADAMAALDFGVSVDSPGYNIFVLGAPGSGKLTFVRRALAARAADMPTPSDWCYVFNFQDPRRPAALELPPGRAPDFQADMERLIADLRDAIPQVLRSDEVAGRGVAMVENQEREAAQVMEKLKADLDDDEFVAFIRTETSMVAVPARGNEPLDREAYLNLSPELQETVDTHVREARAQVFAAKRRIHQIRQESAERLRQLNREVARGELEYRIATLVEKYEGAEGVKAYLSMLAGDIEENVASFADESGGETDHAALLAGQSADEFFRRYQVNPVVTRKPDSGAPVVEEDNPTLTNLFGSIERQMQLGMLFTDFTRIVAGALHRANGGHLIVNANELLARPLAWGALKRMLRTRALRPEEPAVEQGLVVTETLQPQPIPLKVKIVLLGDPYIYYMLQALDSDFAELFKVKADFTHHMERTPEAEHQYAMFVASQCERESLPHFDAAAVAAIVEEGSRLASDQRKLSTRFREIVDLVREGAHWAKAAGAELASVKHVEQGLRERHRRNNRPHREVLDLIDRGVIAFEPAGSVPGQLHGIGLTSMGEANFGRPIRVMASAFMGAAGVVNIEREVQLSGRLHSKGFLILTGYLGRHFARGQPLLLSASLSFDQMYEEIEGDSASVAELYALLSAIGNVPLRQGVAVTGALNQEGTVLPVGGVNQKVEGFFAACERAGLTGEQGVILPRRNAHNLMLRREVRDAVQEGLFKVWAIETVEQGWPILAGMPAGTEHGPASSPKDARRGVVPFPEGTVHHAVASQLATWADRWKDYRESGS